jgi:serine/threonine-protein kinase
MQLGKYELLSRLAVGGMAEVYLARAAGPMGFEKTLVLKRILPHLAEDPSFVEMFLAEAKLVARLNHPNIVQIFDFGEADGEYFLAMEYIDGPNLRALLKRANTLEQPLPAPLCARIIASACEALAFAHDFQDPVTGEPLGLIHRDISTDNILVSRQGAVKVVDFGIAKASGQAPKTRTGIIKGKLAYMPPEQLRAKPLDRRIDVYALGVVFYELLTGQKPYRSPTDAGLMQAILFQPLVPITERRPDLSSSLQPILDRALARDREERYPDCRALQADLEDFIVSTGKAVGAYQLAQLIAQTNPIAGVIPSPSSTSNEKAAATSETEPEPLEKTHVSQAPANPVAKVPPQPRARTAGSAPALAPEDLPTDPEGFKAPGTVPLRRDSHPAALAPDTIPMGKGSLQALAAQEPLRMGRGEPRSSEPETTPMAPVTPPATPDPDDAPMGEETQAALRKFQPQRRWLPIAILGAALLAAGGGYLLAGMSPAPATPAPTPPAEVAAAPKPQPPSGTLPEEPGPPPAPAVAPSPEAPPKQPSTATPTEQQPAPAGETLAELTPRTKSPAAPEPPSRPVRPSTSRPGQTGPSEKSASGTGTLSLVMRGWANIFVDGKPMGRVPPLNELQLPAGQHELVLINPALRPYKTLVTIKAGQTLEHLVEFQTESPQASPSVARPAQDEPRKSSKMGTLHLIVQGWGTIWVDDKKVGEVPPLNKLELSPGKHKLEIVNPAVRQPYQATVTIKAGETLVHRVAFQSPGSSAQKP